MTLVICDTGECCYLLISSKFFLPVQILQYTNMANRLLLSASQAGSRALCNVRADNILVEKKVLTGVCKDLLLKVLITSVLKDKLK